MTRTLKLSLMLALLMAAGRLRAADTVSGAFSSDGEGARPLGMGGAFVALADDGNATVVNPSGMAFYRPKQHFLSFTHSSLFSLSALSRDFLSYSQADEGLFGALGFSWNRFSVDFSPEQYSEDTLMYSGAKQLAGQVNGIGYAVGWNIKYYRVTSGFATSTDTTTVGGAGATGFGGDAGLTVKLDHGLTLAAVAKDVYARTTWETGTVETIPLAAVFGAAYEVDPKTVVCGEGRMMQTTNGMKFDSWHLGAEYWVLDGHDMQWDFLRNFGVRTGYRQELANADAGEASAGVSVKSDVWQLDYAFQFPFSTSALGNSQRFGLSFLF